MIDEAALTTLLHEAAAAIDVPEDGPASVLAARDTVRRSDVTGRSAVTGRPGHQGPGARPRPGWSSEGRNRAIGIAAAVLIVALVAIGVGVSRHGSSSSSSSAEGSAASPTVAAGTPTTIAGVARSSAGASSASGSGASLTPSAGLSANASAATTLPATSVPALPAQVIETGSLSLVVATGTISNVVAHLTSLAVGLDGYVQNSNASLIAPPTASLTLRVPVANFEQLVNQAGTYGKVTSLTTSGQDVTAQSVNLAAQIQAIEASINQYLQILTKAETIPDILSVEQQIDGLQSQLNQLQGQQKVLNDQTSYSTLSVTLSQPPTPAKVPPPLPPKPHKSGLSKAWAHARSSFAHGFESVVSASGGILVFLICVGVLSLIGWLGWRVARRRLV